MSDAIITTASKERLRAWLKILKTARHIEKELRERFRTQSGPDLRLELADMVRDDPDAAATVLSVWIGKETQTG